MLQIICMSFLLQIITFSAFHYVTQLSLYFISTVKNAEGQGSGK